MKGGIKEDGMIDLKLFGVAFATKTTSVK